MKVEVVPNQLKPKRSDYRFTYKADDGKTYYKDCNFRPNDERLPWTRGELAEAAEVVEAARWDGQEHFGWRYFPRQSYTVRLLESYRNGDGEPRNRLVWNKTFNPHPSTGHSEQDTYEIRRRKSFWNDFDSTLTEHRLTKIAKDKICGRVEAKIPRPTKAELRKLEAAIEQRKKNNDPKQEQKQILIRKAKFELLKGDITQEQFDKLIASYE